MIIRYSAIGFALGLVVILLIYMMLVQALGEGFSFQRLGILHKSLWFLYFLDLFPLVSILLGALVGNWRFKQMDQLTAKVQE